jgi:hypothetical protein
MSKLKEKEKEKPKNCHYCDEEADHKFEYKISYRKNVPVCQPHFKELCDMTYPNKESHLPVGQKEYVSIKRLESKLHVINTIQFN